MPVFTREYGQSTLDTVYGVKNDKDVEGCIDGRSTARQRPVDSVYQP